MSCRTRSLAWAPLAIFAIGLVACGSSLAEAAGPARTPWPMYRHDPGHTGFNGAKGPKTNHLKWVFDSGEAEKLGGFENDVTIGPDGTLYIGSNNGILYGLDPASGAIRWVHLSAFDTFAIYSTAAVDSQGLIYYGAKDGYLYALRPPKKGIAMEVAWRFKLGTTIETSPVIGPDGTIYIGADDWKLYAIAPPEAGSSTGRLKWTFQTGGTLISSPAQDADGTVYIGSMDGNLYALADLGVGRTPQIKWTFSTGKRDATGGIETSPVLSGDAVFIGGNDGVLYALERATGKVLWRLKTWFDTYGIFSNPAVGPDRTLYFGPKDGRLLAVTPAGKIAWEYRIGTTIETSPAVGSDGVVYLGADDGKLYAVRPPAGFFLGKPELLWSFSTKGTLIGSPVLDRDGTLYQPSMDGKLYAFHDSAKAAKLPGGFTGTWYGRFADSEKGEGPLTVVAVERAGVVEAALRLGSGATGSASGRVEAGRLSLKGKVAGRGCPGVVRFTGGVEGEKVVGSYSIEGCMGMSSKQGTFELRR
ncbi:MAG: PQQ-binding-like beta-propeller repeat protein [bacterium]